MALAVGHSDLPLLVRVERQDDHPTAWAEHAGALLQRSRRVLGVGQRVKHEDRVEGGVSERQRVDIRDLDADVGLGREPLSAASIIRLLESMQVSERQ